MAAKECQEEIEGPKDPNTSTSAAFAGIESYAEDRDRLAPMVSRFLMLGDMDHPTTHSPIFSRSL
jgi:hypothetical protein